MSVMKNDKKDGNYKIVDAETRTKVNQMSLLGNIVMGKNQDEKIAIMNYVESDSLEKDLIEVFKKHGYNTIITAYRHLDGTLAEL